MEQLNLITEQSPWLILLCFLIGAAYAFVLYQKKSPWTKAVNWFLATLRFVVVTIICLLLLLNPLIRIVKNTIEKPIVVFAIDNSLSLKSIHSADFLKNILTQLQETAQKLQDDEVEIDIQFFGKENISNLGLDSIDFNHPSTNLSEMLNEIRNNYENRNLDKVVMITDGIYNQGISPAFANYNFPVYALGMGDTTPKKDIKLQAVLANKIAYLGNKFPVVAEVENIGYPNNTVNVYLTQNGSVIDKKSVQFQGDGDIQQVTFYAEASAKGMQHFVVNTDILQGEFSTENNRRDIYVEVIDGREKILVVAHTPHPDIKALRSAIGKNENYEFEVYISGIGKVPTEDYDLVIFHQVPNIQRTGNALLEKYAKTPKIYILGSQSDVNAFSRGNKALKVNGRSGQMDEITPYFNSRFDKFLFDDEKAQLLKKYPPLSVPFGDYKTTNGTEVILKQKVGNVETQKPALVISEVNEERVAVFAGEGLWRWRLEEYTLTEKHEVFDELITKVVQFLTTKDDKRKLRVYPVKNEFYDFESVIFETEVYNDLYERIFDTKINLKITSDNGTNKSYSFTPSAGNSRFEISGLEKGVYNYSASANLKGKSETSSGQFTIRDLQLEALNYTADHTMLQELARKTEGRFYLPERLDSLQQNLLDTRKPNLLHSTEDLQELINLWWIFFLLLGLITIEWVTRKYQGSY